MEESTCNYSGKSSQVCKSIAFLELHIQFFHFHSCNNIVFVHNTQQNMFSPQRINKRQCCESVTKNVLSLMWKMWKCVNLHSLSSKINPRDDY